MFEEIIKTQEFAEYATAAPRVRPRDEAIGRRAAEATLVVLAILVFLTALILYETHLASGTVPAGWLYLLAYGTIAQISLVHALATLIIDMTGVVDG